jgi:hypothetical protein
MGQDVELRQAQSVSTQILAKRALDAVTHA